MSQNSKRSRTFAACRKTASAKPEDSEQRFVALARQITEPFTVWIHRLLYWMRKVGVPRHGRVLHDLESYVAAHHGFSLEAQMDRAPDFDVVALLASDWEKTQRQAKPTAIKKQLELNDAERNLLEALGTKTMTGPKIASKAGYHYDYVRHILASLKRRGILSHNADGYKRA